MNPNLGLYIAGLSYNRALQEYDSLLSPELIDLVNTWKNRDLIDKIVEFFKGSKELEVRAAEHILEVRRDPPGRNARIILARLGYLEDGRPREGMHDAIRL